MVLKCVLKLLSGVIVSAVLFPSATLGQTHPSIDSAIVCGYQGWFCCSGDASPMGGWFHWNGSQPSPGHQSFEIYPDISEYPSTDLYQTGYAALGDGRPAKLYSAYKYDASDLHCKWMQQNGIDGVAIQRFLSSGNYRSFNDSVEVHMMRAAEKYNRLFYIMYDGVGDNMSGLESDWQTQVVAALKLTQSPRYAYMNGKPVVCFWGFGLTTYSDNPTDALAAVNWFKNNGCYVIGGVPTNWRVGGTGDTKAGYSQVYAAFNMISPWTVGRYKTDSDVDNYKKNFLVPDKAKLDSEGIAYQPVMFPGFAWSNWNGGARNDYPRRQGKFMWRQFYNIRSLGINHVYVAMFDEYDEGTAINKAAADYFDAPTNQYFQTTSIDSVYVSSDFYLRLVGAATSALKLNQPVTTAVPIPNSVGPVYFRSSFEPACDAQLTWTNSSDSATGGIQNVTGAQCAVTSGTAASGSYAVRYSGSASSSSRATARFKIISANWILVDSQTTLSFSFNPQNTLGRYACVDLAASDGTLLSSTSAADTQGISMAPATGRGVVNQWTTVKCQICRWLSGKTINRILVTYDHSGDAGAFSGFIDNLKIVTTSSSITTAVANAVSFSTRETERPKASYEAGVVRITGLNEIAARKAIVSIFSGCGRLVAQRQGDAACFSAPLHRGFYIVKVTTSAGLVGAAKLVVQ